MAKTNLQFRDLDIGTHERVIECIDSSVGLHAIIAIHDTRLGPALGGIRAYPYASFEHALTDVLRLSQGMSHKAAVAQVGTGGGKAVIILKPGQVKTPELLRSFAEAVNSLGGQYICAEDYGVTQQDLALMAQYTRFIVGIPQTSGNPSPFTAFGGLRGIAAVCQHLWGSDSVEGKTIAIQGLGAVGMQLARGLFWAGANLIVSDINPEFVKLAVRDFSAVAVSTEEIASVECDIFAPCALGGILNQDTIAKLKCRAVAGLANNQLLTSEDGERLLARGILYAPDYVINAGGLINVCQEIRKEGYDARAARVLIAQLYDVLLKIFDLAEKKAISTNRVAQEIAEHHLDTGIGKRMQEPVFHH